MIESSDVRPPFETILQPDEQVLSTLQADGSRRWLKPKLSKHRLLWYRRVTAYMLIAIFTIVPFVKIAGKPIVLLDITARRFTILGWTFLPTDTVLLAIFLVGLLLSVFLFTALWGRIWCGWACPQTVYMEFVFRPLERFFDGTSGRGGHKKRVPAWRTACKYIAYAFISLYLTHTFLAYFVGVDELRQWIAQSPLQHPIPFLVMVTVTFMMMVDFCFFREQMCLLACPYGRLQSVLLDQNSLIVAYNSKRGEPRGHKVKDDSRQTTLPVIGDCIDCGNCVSTCPTGIDIRDGLQMECIHCAQCIDACNIVMEKIGRDPNLIRYSSQARDQNKTTQLMRPRVIIYPLMLMAVVTTFVLVLWSSKSFDAVLLREPGVPQTLNEEGLVRNLLRLKITNRTSDSMAMTVELEHPLDGQIEIREDQPEVAAESSRQLHMSVLVPTNRFSNGRANVSVRVSNEHDESRTIQFKMIGPYSD